MDNIQYEDEPVDSALRLFLTPHNLTKVRL